MSTGTVYSPAPAVQLRLKVCRTRRAPSSIGTHTHFSAALIHQIQPHKTRFAAESNWSRHGTLLPLVTAN